jgi:hypothetical protein
MGKIANVGGKWGKKLLFGLAAMGLAAGLSGGAAQAQSKMQVFGGYSYNSGGANQYYCIEICSPGTSNNGYAASYAYSFTPHIALEGAFSGYDGTTTPFSYAPGTIDSGYAVKDDAKKYFYTVGPRLSYPVGDFSMFSHFLVGGAHIHETITETCTPSENGCGTPNPLKETDSGNGLAFKVGGGVDWNHGAWGIRLLELDYVRTQLNISGTTNQPQYEPTFSTYLPASSLQFAVGVTFNFGGSVK